MGNILLSFLSFHILTLSSFRARLISLTTIYIYHYITSLDKTIKSINSYIYCKNNVLCRLVYSVYFIVLVYSVEWRHSKIVLSIFHYWSKNGIVIILHDSPPLSVPTQVSQWFISIGLSANSV